MANSETLKCCYSGCESDAVVVLGLKSSFEGLSGSLHPLCRGHVPEGVEAGPDLSKAKLVEFKKFMSSKKYGWKGWVR